MYLESNWKKNKQFPLEQQKIKLPMHLAQLPIWKGGLDILGIDTQ